MLLKNRLKLIREILQLDVHGFRHQNRFPPYNCVTMFGKINIDNARYAKAVYDFLVKDMTDIEASVAKDIIDSYSRISDTVINYVYTTTKD